MTVSVRYEEVAEALRCGNHRRYRVAQLRRCPLDIMPRVQWAVKGLNLLPGNDLQRTKD